MKRKSVALALMPACFVVSNLCASAQALGNSATAPEMAAEANKPIAIERSIKIPGLAVSKEALPNMSESSAVRMACGGSPITVYSKYNPAPKLSPSPVVTQNPQNYQNSRPSPAPMPHPVAMRVNKAATTTVQPAAVKPPVPLVKPAAPMFAPLSWFFH